MLKELIKMAGEFDRLGLRKEADQVDAIIRKVAGPIGRGPHTYSMGRNRLMGDHSFLTKHNPDDLKYHPELDEIGHIGEYNEDEDGGEDWSEANPEDIEEREVRSPEDIFYDAEREEMGDEHPDTFNGMPDEISEDYEKRWIDYGYGPQYVPQSPYFSSPYRTKVINRGKLK